MNIIETVRYRDVLSGPKYTKPRGIDCALVKLQERERESRDGKADRQREAVYLDSRRHVYTV